MSNLSASLVPETLRRGWQRAPTPADAHASFGSHGAVLWCDIARYSPMAKALVAQGNSGVEKLSSLLQRHFDRVTAIVQRHGGDCTEFFGDGVLVVFAAESTARLADAAISADLFPGLSDQQPATVHRGCRRLRQRSVERRRAHLLPVRRRVGRR